MRTIFACPTCRAPLLVKCVAAVAPEISSALCPNPFCRTELPSRRDKAALLYALVGTGSDLERELSAGRRQGLKAAGAA